MNVFKVVNNLFAIPSIVEQSSTGNVLDISNSIPVMSCSFGVCAAQTNQTICLSTCNCSWSTTGCNCTSRVDGDPACQGQYIAPDNSSIIYLASHSLLTSSDRITFFGDSITARLGYINIINQTLNSYNITPTLINRGVSGATIKNIRDGHKGQPNFNTVLKDDNPTLVNIMIGINDVWHVPGPETSTVDEFTEILIDLVHRVQAFGAKVAISTVSVIGEQTNGQNGHDEELAQFADATRYVASITGAALSDVHAEYLLYGQLHNVYPPGVGLFSGVLTWDGVHPCESPTVCPLDSNGNIILANTISKGLIKALNYQKK